LEDFYGWVDIDLEKVIGAFFSSRQYLPKWIRKPIKTPIRIACSMAEIHSSE
jgi:hypothetical protein